MRIVFITTKLNFITSGASVTELDIKVRTLMERGHEVLVITMFSTANHIPDSLPYRVVEESSGSGRQLAIQRNAYRVLKKFEKEADAFYLDGQVFLYGAGLYRLLGGMRPVYAHFNRELQAWPELVSSLFGVPRKSLFVRAKQSLRFSVEKYFGIPLANRMDAVSFTNPHLEKTYRDFGLRVKYSFVAGDAFDWRKFMRTYDVTEGSYRARNKRSGPLTIYYSGRMAPGKGFDTLIEAFSKLRDTDGFRLILGGSGPEEAQVKGMVHDLGLDAHVTFTGWAPKNDHYARLKEVTDIFVQPMQSGMDKTSYILLEAMAFGVPSVLPADGGLQWDAKGSALYFKGGDTDDLARKIEELGKNPELRAKLSEKAYERLREPEMDFEQQIALLEERMRLLVEAA